jgi:Flp pilus assembly protein TadD
VLLCLAFESRDHAQAQSNPLAEPAPKNPSNGSAEKVTPRSNTPRSNTPRHLTPRPDNPQDAEILHWIEQLGSDSFSERLEAQGRLERFGLDALDLLRSATEHSDPQIAAQARFMVQSGRFANVTTTAPFELRKLLELFDTSDTDGKISQIQSLNRLDNYLGVRPLCRIARFECNPQIAKFAALELMRRLSPFEPAATLPIADDDLSDLYGSLSEVTEGSLNTNTPQQTKLAAIIAEATQGARSEACQWLRLAFVTDNPSTFPLDQWSSIVQYEEQLTLSSHSDASIHTLAPLMRWVAEQASLDPSTRQEALEIGRRLSEITLARQPTILPQIQFCEWSLRAKLPELVPAHFLSSDSVFPQQAPSLLNYLLAESFAMQGKQELADQIARLARARATIRLQKDLSLDVNSTAEPPENPTDPLALRSNSEGMERAVVAEALINRGSFAWAEAELRVALEGRYDSPEFASTVGLSLLSQLLHEQDRDEEASKVLEAFAQRFENEKLFQMQIDSTGSEIPSTYHMFAANVLAKNGKHEEARSRYLKAVELYPENVDALIGLARLPETNEQKTMRLQEQSQVVILLRNEIEEIDRQLRLAAPMFQKSEKRRLATQLNTYAWLIANTEGDQQEALLMSRRACTLSPDRSALQDTLAHCYERQGNFDAAVRAQRKAVALEPHQPSLHRALKRFEEKAKEKREKNE